MGPRMMLERFLLVAILVVLTPAFVLSYLAATDTTSCEDTRIEIQKMITLQNMRSREQLRSGSIFQFFPGVPRADLRRGILDSVEARRAIKDNLDPADC